MNPIIIDKDQVNSLEFLDFDVLDTKDKREERKEKLHKAMILGNGQDHVKVNIVLKSKQGFFKIVTTIWAVGDNSIQLKSGVNLPISAIEDVIF